MIKVFLDTSYIIALSSQKDKYHNQALLLSDRLQSENAQLITTRAILIETGNAMSKQRYRLASIKLLEVLEQDRNIEIIPITEEIYKLAFILYRERKDKEWGMTDCISFTVMKEHKIVEALTADYHFQQAGFKALLLER